MSDNKPITGDMRRWWELHVNQTVDADLREGFGNLCDAIDAIHANLERENDRLKQEAVDLKNRLDAVRDGDGWRLGFDEGFASADDWLADNEDAMAEHGWVRLPKDADGEYIHVGDVMDGYSKTIKVVELRNAGTWHLVDEFGNEWHDHAAFTHHHTPTVEDVLREMLDAWGELPAEEENEAIIAEYAPKLRLAGEDA